MKSKEKRALEKRDHLSDHRSPDITGRRGRSTLGQ